MFRPVQRSRTGDCPRQQHLRRALMPEIAIRKAHARNRTTEAALVFPVEIEAWLERDAHWRFQTLLETDPWKRFMWSFVALEVLSLPLYLMCGMARRRRLLSQEAAVKYFLLGAFSSAFFLFGVAMLYGFSGSVRLAAIATAASSNVGSSTLLYAGMALLCTGQMKSSARPPM